MNKDEQFDLLLGSYLTANPTAENPRENIYIFGVDGLIELLTIAENRLIEFRIGKNAADDILPYIDNKLIKLEYC